jgi:hypothetical protein
MLLDCSTNGTNVDEVTVVVVSQIIGSDSRYALACRVSAKRTRINLTTS